MVEAVLLGVAQDAGIPQAACSCARCQRARTDFSWRVRVACLGLIDSEAEEYWIIDATPDFKDQFGYMMDAAPDSRFGGILLTHLHMGHFTGLIHLGEEAADLTAVPLYCTSRVWSFLRTNAPWSRLIQRGNLSWQEIVPGKDFVLTEGLLVRPIEVPHRSPDGETLAFGVLGPDRGLFYCPDIDSWEAWGIDLKTFLSTYEVALLDGSFYGREEVPGRDMAEIPHPLVPETMDILEGLDKELVFIHLNHTNPMLSSGAPRSAAVRRGFQVGFEGQRWDLGLRG